MATITCRKCHQTLPESEFNATEAAGNTSRCRACLKLAKQSENKNPKELDLDPVDLSCVTWQGGKYHGHIIEKDGAFFPRIDGKQKTFRFDETNRDAMYTLANKWRKDNGVPTNKYKIIFEMDQPTFVIVQLSKGYVTLVDFNQLDFIKSHFLCVTRSGDENSQQYCIAQVDGKNKRIHACFTQFKMVDHINGYPLDNRLCNLRETNSSENNKNRSVVHKTYVAKSKYDNSKYEAIVIYNDHSQSFKKIAINELFDTRELAQLWINNKCNELDKRLQVLPQRQQLKEQYEEIMEKYGDGFKWRDLIEDERPNEQANDATPIGAKLASQNAKYNIFKNIAPDWSIPPEFNTSIKLEHIVYQDSEYKFCNTCSNWVTIDKFHKSASKHDGLDTRCKDCAKNKKKMKSPYLKTMAIVNSLSSHDVILLDVVLKRTLVHVRDRSFENVVRSVNFITNKLLWDLNSECKLTQFVNESLILCRNSCSTGNFKQANDIIRLTIKVIQVYTQLCAHLKYTVDTSREIRI